MGPATLSTFSPKTIDSQLLTLDLSISDDDYVMVNESALYLSDRTSTEIFAHICFPPKYIEKKSEFVIEWYILC